jgi:cyclopropane-fatty-acyl-phospholipid synthase
MNAIDTLISRDLVPDSLIRLGIRRLLRQRLRESLPSGEAAREQEIRRFTEAMDAAPVALQTAAANEQHYEVPTAFYERCLGPRLKYSSGLWGDGVGSLAEAEDAMLALTCERAGLKDGQLILELGCGWGSLSLWMAEHFPNAKITAVSNSRTQKEHIDEQIRRRGLANLSIVTADMNDFSAPEASFDRVVSVEMFEHMRNWRLLLGRIASWLRPDGRLFIHIFTHRRACYLFEVKDATDWMSRYFFSGGMMPADDLLPRIDDRLVVEQKWQVPGTHYSRTAEAWLQNLDGQREAVLKILGGTHGRAASRWLAYWRVFFMACAELWGYRGGSEWIVSHYRLAPRAG